MILVFSLASIVLLLGLSLVSLTQVESASSRYDQGLRVARANARLALQMAVGDLQELAGPDQRITATADGARTDGTGPIGASFNDVTDPATNGVYQPFWTGVWDNVNTTDTPIWLVTRPLDATYNFFSGTQDADPFASDLGTTNTFVKLVGQGSAKPENPGSGQSDYDIYVPKEPVTSTAIVGMASSEEAAIGHYAYWVGDNGVKANYLLEDWVPEVLHDGYEDGGLATYEQLRLEQMAAHRNFLEIDARLMDATDIRLGAIASDLALREGYTDEGSSTVRSLLGSLTHNDVLRRFHDVSGQSRGLLADTVRGGMKEDLSVIHSVDTGSTVEDDLVDDLVNNYLMPYLNVVALSPTLPTDLTRSYAIAPKNTAFTGLGPRPAVVPLITEFNLLIRLSSPELLVSPINDSPVYGEFGVSVELWNPFTSHVQGEALTLRILNLGDATGIVATHYHDGAVVYVYPSVGLKGIMNDVTDFEIAAPGTGEDWWNPGEIRVFSGAFESGTSVSLIPGNSVPTGQPFDYVIDVFHHHHIDSPDAFLGKDKIALVGPVWSPEIALLSASGVELYRYTLNEFSFNEIMSSPTVVNDIAQTHLSYKLELRNPDSNWQHFDPRSGEIGSNLIMDDFVDPDTPPEGYDPIAMTFYEYPGSATAINNASIESSATDLLGYNSDGNVVNNLPMFELPRQEFLSLGALQMAEFPSKVRHQLGMSNSSNPFASINDVFDRFFLSTVPQGSTTWNAGDPLPNGRMEVVAGSTIGDLQDGDSAKHLYLNGAFNINSTSVEAWTSLLKGIRLGAWAYDDPAGSVPVAGQEELDLSGENQFLRFSQSAEETWKGTYDAGDPLDAPRERFRKGLRSFADTEIELLATNIVKGIRERRQATGATVGPFVGLQDFIDSGVIETAIGSAGADLNIGIPEAYVSSYLTQQDVLTAIAPYLSARSDTFIVRAYGDAVNPFDATEVLARTYCEAIVQRTHEKHSTESSTDIMVKTDNTPGSYGRKFKVIAFRWMTGDEL